MCLSNLLSSDVSSSNASLCILAFPRCFISIISNMPAIINAKPSANGPEYKNPFIPKVSPSKIIAGIKNSTCLDNESIALFALFPIA